MFAIGQKYWFKSGAVYDYGTLQGVEWSEIIEGPKRYRLYSDQLGQEVTVPAFQIFQTPAMALENAQLTHAYLGGIVNQLKAEVGA